MSGTEVKRITGLTDLWSQTMGDPSITIALLDGPVDRSHPCFAGALLESVPTMVSDIAGGGRMSAHGTHIASMIFGQPGGPIVGVAPGCRGLIVPVYSDDNQGPTPQMDLARAINQAVSAGAHVINISGGELSNNGEADPFLISAVRGCNDAGVLIVAAAGNDRCRCLHVPAALPAVLAVGASDLSGVPHEASNWGDAYQSQGVLAPGVDMLGAAPGGGATVKTGTSFATPVVTGVVGLLLGLQLKRGLKPDAHAIREAILASAIPCDAGLLTDCQRFLVGRLNVSGAHTLISPSQKRGTTMSEVRIDGSATFPNEAFEPAPACSSGIVPQEQIDNPSASGHEHDANDRGSGNASPVASPTLPTPSPLRSRLSSAAPAVRPSGILASDCGCNGDNTKPLIFALGVLGYDFGTEARRDTFKSLMPQVDPNNGLIPFSPQENVVPFPPNPYDPRQMVNYLAGYPRPRPPFPTQGGLPALTPWFPDEIPKVPAGYRGFAANLSDGAELIWTLNIELTPVYAIKPTGNFSTEIYQRLVEFLDGQTRDLDDPDYVSRVSIPGYLAGSTVRLFSGEVLPVIVPNLRGMFGWNETALVDAAIERVKEKNVRMISTRGLDMESAPAQQQVTDAVDKTKRSLRGFLDRIYYDLRNLGQTSAERALNFTATNAFQAATVLTEPAADGLELDTIGVEKSPFCRKDSDCWDVKMRFFDPDNVLRARSVSRFTVDVSDVYPVLVGPIRTWSEAG